MRNVVSSEEKAQAQIGGRTADRSEKEGRMTTEMEDETMKLERLNEKFEEQ